jgi:hypothetical protein
MEQKKDHLGLFFESLRMCIATYIESFNLKD